MPPGGDVDHLAIEFLGERIAEVPGTQTSLHVGDGQALVERGESSTHRRGGITLDDH